MPAAPAVPTVDFVRPNPLDSDIIMDATARLLAPRKPIYAQPKPESSSKVKREAKQESHREAKQAVKKEHKRETKHESNPEVKHESVRKTPNPARAAEKKKSRHSHGNRVPMPPRYPSFGNRQKDSTQQRGSMMKPYYLSDD